MNEEREFVGGHWSDCPHGPITPEQAKLLAEIMATPLKTLDPRKLRKPPDDLTPGKT